MHRVMRVAVVVAFALSSVALADEYSEDAGASTATTESQSSTGDSSSTNSMDDQGHGGNEPGTSNTDSDESGAINQQDPSPR